MTRNTTRDLNEIASPASRSGQRSVLPSTPPSEPRHDIRALPCAAVSALASKRDKQGALAS